MKKALGFAAPLIALALMSAPAIHAQYQQDPREYPTDQQRSQYPNNYYQNPQYNDGRWDAPPNDYNDLNRRAFHDGIDAARVDAQANRRMDFDDAANYKRPPVSRNFRAAYRASFARGYQMAQQRMTYMHEHNDNDWRHDHDNWNNHYQPR